MATKKGSHNGFENAARRVTGGAIVSTLALAALAGTPSTLLAQDAPTSGNAPSVPPAATEGVKGTNFGEDALIDLHVNDEDLGNVLQMLSLQNQRNIIASKNVSARVTANLYNVSFREALDAILHANGFGYIEKGNFVYVYTLQELTEIEKANQIMTSKVIRLNYLSAVDAADFVSSLLSEKGSIKSNGKVEAFGSLDGPTGGENFAHGATLLVADFEENVNEILARLAELDTPPSQVLVEATILQTRLNEQNAFGVDFALVGDIDFADFAAPLQVVNALQTDATDAASTADGKGMGLVSSVGGTSGANTLKLGITRGDVSAFIRVLDEVTDTTILSNPKLLALNRMPSRVLVGRKVGYVSTTSTDTATTQTVQFLDTGTQLYFRPFVSNDGKIRMELKPQVSEAQIRDVQDSGGQTVTIPDEITNELVTNVIVRDGETIVLGGLFRESTTATRRQIPFLGDLPWVGAAFRGNDDVTERNEIIFLITPSIVNEATLADMGARGMEFADRARTGARNGVLPWSRDRMSAARNVEAERLFREGKNDEANWKLSSSLALNPVQPDAMALRERVTGKVKTTAGRSMLEEIIHGESILRRGETQVRAGEPVPFDVAEFWHVNPGQNANVTVPLNEPTAQPEDFNTWDEPTDGTMNVIVEPTPAPAPAPEQTTPEAKPDNQSVFTPAPQSNNTSTPSSDARIETSASDQGLEPNLDAFDMDAAPEVEPAPEPQSKVDNAELRRLADTLPQGATSGMLRWMIVRNSENSSFTPASRLSMNSND